MSAGIIQEIDRERDQELDVERLIEAVRGSRAARVLFEYRPKFHPANPPSLNTSETTNYNVQS